MATSVFADQYFDAFVHYNAEIHIDYLIGGTPTDPRIIEGWLRKNMGERKDEEIARMVMATIEERGLNRDEAETEVIANSRLNGFKIHGPDSCVLCRNGDQCPDAAWNGLYLEGRCVKAAIKEAANSTWPKRKWGPSSKGTLSMWAEHVHVLEDRIPLNRQEADAIEQSFVHVWRGHGFKYEEVIYSVPISFTVAVTKEGDAMISSADWAAMWLHGEKLGMGASRSQGRGRYAVTRWDRRK